MKFETYYTSQNSLKRTEQPAFQILPPQIGALQQHHWQGLLKQNLDMHHQKKGTGIFPNRKQTTALLR